MSDEATILSRVADRSDDEDDWVRLDALAAGDPELWERLRETLRLDAMLRSRSAALSEALAPTPAIDDSKAAPSSGTTSRVCCSRLSKPSTSRRRTAAAWPSSSRRSAARCCRCPLLQLRRCASVSTST